jgi:hypothetical protein
MSPDC